MTENNIDTEAIEFFNKLIWQRQCEYSHKVFEGLANMGKSSMGWFFGFKLHFTCDINGYITNMVVTNANVDDRN